MCRSGASVARLMRLLMGTVVVRRGPWRSSTSTTTTSSGSIVKRRRSRSKEWGDARSLVGHGPPSRTRRGPCPEAHTGNLRVTLVTLMQPRTPGGRVQPTLGWHKGLASWFCASAPVWARPAMHTRTSATGLATESPFEAGGCCAKKIPLVSSVWPSSHLGLALVSVPLCMIFARAGVWRRSCLARALVLLYHWQALITERTHAACPRTHIT
jgi:hypothetical protein